MRKHLSSIVLVIFWIVPLIGIGIYTANAQSKEPEPEIVTVIEYIEVAAPPMVEYVPYEVVIEVPATPPPNRYSGLEISEADIDLMAKLVWHEARGESFAGQRMVIEVVLNRVLSDRFPDTVYDVIYQTNQFSPAYLLDSTTATNLQYEAVYAALTETPITDADVVFFSGAAYNDAVFCRIGGHTFCRLSQ